MVDWTSRVWLRYEDEGIRGSQCSNDYIVELRLELMSRVLLTVADPSSIINPTHPYPILSNSYHIAIVPALAELLS